MKQTAVQWLVEQITYATSEGVVITYHKDITQLVEQALEMEKEQKHESVNSQVNILKDTLEEMMTGFDSEEDKMDFILDICNGYKKRINKSE